MLSHLSCITWEQSTRERQAPSEMKLRGGMLGTRTLDLVLPSNHQVLLAPLLYMFSD